MTSQKAHHSINRSKRPNGFILLEVLVAMSLIMGSWMVSAHTYQKLALILGQQEGKRSQIRKEMDAYEIEIHSKAVTSHQAGSVRSELAGVSGRNNTLRSATKPAIKSKRAISSQANGI